jgi:signal transduction histidine kinase/CheY-like chemotaxis protein
MKFWSKKSEGEPARISVARAALSGASTEVLLQHAIQMLAHEAQVSRVGIWIETESVGTGDLHSPSIFQGVVWDDSLEAVPTEWSRLSPEAPLPQELLLDVVCVEQELGVASEIPMIGPLLGLQHVLWVPVKKRNHLCGVILMGSRKKHAHLPSALAESVATELELALEFAEQRSLALGRSADIAFSRRTLFALGTPAPVFSILSDIVESCTLSAEKHGPGAAFAVLGAVGPGSPISLGSFELEFLWKSGDPEWTSAVECEPLAGIWRKSLESHRLIGSDPGVSWSRGEISRVVTIPLESDGETLGALIVGLRRVAASLATLERLEFRAALATRALKRRNNEQAESSHRELQQRMIEMNPTPAFLLDSNGYVVQMSEAAREFLGDSWGSKESSRNSAEVRRPFTEFFTSKSQRQIEVFCRQLLSGTGAFENLPEAELSNGVRTRIRAAFPASQGFFVIELDLLRQAGDVESAERAEVELQSVLEWLEEGVVLFDAQENVRAVNTRFEQIAGLAPHESGTFKTLDAWIARLEVQAADPVAFAGRWRELARGIEGGVREELHMSRPAPRILERASRGILDVAGRRLGRLEIYRDLTAQRVFQSKLLQTEKLAALGQMVTGVAHELSNPLTSVLGYAQRLLLRGDVLAKSQEVRQIYQEAERATGILRQLLFTAREAPPERRPVAMNQVVQRAMEVQTYGLAAEKINIQLDLDPVLPYVLGDAGQLQQVLMNLVGNARQAIEQTGKPGTILLRTRRTGERFVQLEVIDNGPGIPHAIQARIFDPFFTTKPAGVGTGLGLAIVLGIVREHGGRVQVSTPPGGGAAFSIELPALAAAPAWKESETIATRLQRPILVPTQPPLSGGQFASSTTPAVGATRVLVVEDEPTVARLIADVLEEEGLRVDVLLDGREALDRARRESFDLVICDMKMPGIDGQHFYNTLARAGNPLCDHFLFVTGDVIAPHTHEFLARNHLPHVAKPFRVEELTEKVRRMLPALHRGAAVTAVVKRNVAGNG